MRGTVRHWDVMRQFGKVVGDDRIPRFVHVDELIDTLALRPGERVEFDHVDTPRGPRAESVRRIEIM